MAYSALTSGAMGWPWAWAQRKNAMAGTQQRRGPGYGALVGHRVGDMVDLQAWPHAGRDAGLPVSAGWGAFAANRDRVIILSSLPGAPGRRAAASADLAKACQYVFRSTSPRDLRRVSA